MDPKIKKGLRLAAAAIFVFALALNIKITLDDPFMMMSDKAVASTTYNSGGGGSSSSSSSSSNSTYYAGYYNKTIVIYDYTGDLGVYVGSGKIPVGITINIGASGSLTYCESSFWWWKKCYENLNGFTPFS